MQVKKIIDKKTGVEIVSISDDDIVAVNPIKYYHDYFIASSLITNGVPKSELNGSKKISEHSRSIFVEATIAWKKQLVEIENTVVPKELLRLLKTTKKKEQEKLLKGLELDPDILMAFLFKAYSKHGFLFSQYRVEIPQKGIELSKMPVAYEVTEENGVEKFGATEYSDGQLTQAINHRKVIISKFVEKDDRWHCFFTNYNSLNGGETWLGEKQPHFHYISDSFGFTKEQVITELSSGKYKLGNLPHIKLTGYGNQPK